MTEEENQDSTTGECGSKEHSFLYRFHGEWLEITATVLLALATIFSAWSAYQAARWGGVEAKSFNKANEVRIQSSKEADLADTDFDIDAEMFVDYVGALQDEDEEAARYFEDTLFRDEMWEAVEAWLATDPFNNPNAPETPFAMDEYKNSHEEKSKELDEEGQQLANDAREAIERSDRYVLLTVLFASVLFFAGVCTKFKKPNSSVPVIIMGYLLFFFAVIILAFQPIH